jgi:carboxypeptidase family protein/TonB-dependent receptor-like protein
MIINSVICRSCTRVARLGIFAMLICTLASVLIADLMAQTNKATVQGTVTDEKGDVILDARITAVNLDTGITRQTLTDQEGRYRIVELLPGIYEVSVERQGFRLYIQRGVELTVGRDAVMDFKLNVGDIEEKVVLEQDAGLVDITSSTMGHLVNRKQIEQLPLNGRDVLKLATLENGIISTSSTTDVQSNLGPGNTRLVSNGGRIEYNAFLLDGTETADAFGYSPGGLGGGFLGVDALREFQVLTSNYSAEYGHGGGAIINAITKSGTNQIHGTAFEFLRNSALDARNPFDLLVPGKQLPFQRNQFGGSSGGPIIKDRAFLFANYEGLRRREGVPSLFNVPSPNARIGNLTSGPVTVAPAVLPYLALYPLPNGPVIGDTGIYTRNFKERTNEDFLTLRADYKLTGLHSLAGRYTADNSDLTRVGGVIQNLILNNINQYVALEEQAIVGGRGVNSLRGTYNRSSFNSAFPFIVPVDPSLAFMPGRELGAFNLSGVSPLRDTNGEGRSFILNQFEVNDQFIYSLGAHALKVGGSIRRYQMNTNSAFLNNGVYVYGGGLSDFLTGNPVLLVATLPGTDYYRGIRQSLFNAYVQDDWKLTQRLTLNLGLRYEPISTPTEVNGKVATLRNITDPAPTVGDPYIDNPSLKNIAPRVGFALDIFGDGKTSLRGAAGIFYSAILPMRYRFEMSSGAPFAQLVAFPAFGGAFPDAFSRSGGNILPGFGVIYSTAFNAEQPTVYQWNINVQRELGRNLIMSAGYVGSRGNHMETAYTANVRTDYQLVYGQKFFPAGSRQLLNPNYTTITYLDFSADSYYHALQVNLTKRFSSGLQFQAAYTMSKSMDTASSTETVFLNGAPAGIRQDPFDSTSERGLSDYDARHNFIANYLYDLPFGKGHMIGGNRRGVTGTLVAGWSTGGIINLRSGFPFNVALGFDRANNGVDNVQSQRPNVAPGVDLSKAITGNPMAYVNPTFFQLQPAGFYGNLSRNALRGPGLVNFDMTLMKRTPITERLQSEFRIEAFNVFNRTNFAPPIAANRVIYTDADDVTGAPVLSPFFGQLTQTATSSRQLQFGFKFLW